MYVVVFSFSSLGGPHLETDLEIAQQHLDEGDRVLLVTCDGSVGSCNQNLHNDRLICLRCRTRRSHGIRLLEGRLEERSIRKFYPANLAAREAELPQDLESLPDLKAVRVEDFDLGYAALSSIVSRLREPEPDLSEWRQEINALLRSGLRAYLATLDLLSRESVDRVYVFNGRFALHRGVLRACEKAGVDCVLHDRGSSRHHYSTFTNVLPHDVHAFQAAMEESWRTGDPDKRAEIGAAWFEERVAGKEQAWTSFVAGQKKDALPESWNEEHHNIVIFNSSEDEFAAIGPEWDSPIYPSQQEGLESILAGIAACGDPSVRVYLRIHPNLRGIENSAMRKLMVLEAPFLEILPPESPVSSYGLMREADRVLTFGSSAGLEATYWGTPSILAGMSFYRGLDAAYEPRDHEEVMDLLLRPDLSAKPRVAVIKYGYHVRTFGIGFKYFNPIHLWQGTFKGKRVRPNLFVEGVFKIGFLRRLLVDEVARGGTEPTAKTSKR